MDAAKTVETLRNKGYRIGRVRKEILALFSRANKPLSAQDIATLLENNSISANKTTVYRELDFLIDQSLIKELSLSSSTRHFESSDQGHHHHLVCESCNAISPIEDSRLENRLNTLEQQVLSSKKFHIHRHALEFFGTCKTCQTT